MSQTSRISVLSSTNDTRLAKRVSIVDRNLNKTRGAEVNKILLLGVFPFRLYLKR